MIFTLKVDPQTVLLLNGGVLVMQNIQIPALKLLNAADERSKLSPKTIKVILTALPLFPLLANLLPYAICYKDWTPNNMNNMLILLMNTLILQLEAT